MQKPIRLILLSFVALLSACATTQIEESWTLPGYQAPAPAERKVLVVALAAEDTVRKAFENSFVQQLEHNGITAVASHTRIADSSKVNRQTLRPIVAQNQITSVLVSSIRGIEKAQTYQPPTQVGPSDNLYRNFDTYQVYSSTGHNEPGTYVEMTEYLLETNLFNTKTEKLSWSVKTRTSEQTSLKKGVDSVVKAVMKQATKDRIL
jgi:hypothetical protein